VNAAVEVTRRDRRVRRRRWLRHAVFIGLACLTVGEVTAVLAHRHAAKRVHRSVIVVGDTPAPSRVPSATSLVQVPVPTRPNWSKGATTAVVRGSSDSVSVAPGPASPGQKVPDRWMTIASGVLSLRGAVPTAEVAAVEGEKLSAVVGAKNTLVGYTIVPGVAVAAATPIYVADKPAFEVQSAMFSPSFRSSLQSLGAILAAYPTARVVVVARSDGTGLVAADNLAADRIKIITAALIVNGAAAEQIESASFPAMVDSPFDTTIDFLLSGLLAT
jgi:hypothetical protein